MTTAQGSPGFAPYVPPVIALVFQVGGVFISAHLVKQSRDHFADLKIDDAARAGAENELMAFSFFSQLYLTFVPVVVALFATAAFVSGSGRELAVIGGAVGAAAILVAGVVGQRGEFLFGEINSSARSELAFYERAVLWFRMTRLSDAVVWLLIVLTFVYQLITAYVSG